MARMLLSLEGVVIREVLFASEHTTFGRRPYSDVVIDNPAVSGEHALVRLEGDDLVLEDLQSTNGTYVNGLPITRHVLQEGDRVEIGRYQLKFERGPGPLLGKEAGVSAAHAGDRVERRAVPRDGAPAPARAPAAAKVAAAPGGAAANPAAAARKRAGDPPDAPAGAAPEEDGPLFAETTVPTTESATLPVPAMLTVLSGSSAGKQVELIKVVTTIGKPGVGIASITRRVHGFSLVHVQGDAMPSLNGVTVGDMPVLLNHGDLVELAGIRMQFAQGAG